MVAERLRSGFEGEVIGPEDATYEAARAVWNAMIDRKPALIARCATTADVTASIRAARDEGLEIIRLEDHLGLVRLSWKGAWNRTGSAVRTGRVSWADSGQARVRPRFAWSRRHLLLRSGQVGGKRSGRRHDVASDGRAGRRGMPAARGRWRCLPGTGWSGLRWTGPRRAQRRTQRPLLRPRKAPATAGACDSLPPLRLIERLSAGWRDASSYL